MSGFPSDQNRLRRKRQVTASVPSARKRRESLVIAGTSSTSTGKLVPSASVRVTAQNTPRLVSPPIGRGSVLVPTRTRSRSDFGRGA